MKRIIITLLSLFIITGCSYFENDTNLDDEPKLVYEGTNYSYYYNLLSDDDKQLYIAIYDCLIDYQDQCQINNNDYNTVTNVTNYVLYDHPEIYYLDYFQIENQVKVCNFIPTYSYSYDETVSINEKLETVKNNFINSIDSSLSDYEKIKAVYQYVINNCEYLENAKDNQEVTSALIYGQTVCSGYVKAIQYLCDGLDIDTTYIVGYANEQIETEDESHAWSLVNLDDDYYYLDATWGDYIEEGNEFVMYSYFMFDYDDMMDLYTPDDQYEETDHGQYCYFEYEGYYVDYYDIDMLVAIVRKQRSLGLDWIEIKFDDSCYQEAKERLIDDQEMFDVFDHFASGEYYVNYIYNDDLGIITLKLSQ